MVRINLVPKEIGRKETLKKQLELFILAIILVVVVIIFIYTSKVAQLVAAKKELTLVNNRLEEMKTIVAQVEDYQRKKESLTRRVNVIKELVKGQFTWVEVLDEINNCLPAGVWVNSVASSKKGTAGGLVFTAQAFDNFAIADFITALENSQYFSKVELGYIQKSQSGEGQVTVLQFQLTSEAVF